MNGQKIITAKNVCYSFNIKPIDVLNQFEAVEYFDEIENTEVVGE